MNTSLTLVLFQSSLSRMIAGMKKADQTLVSGIGIPEVCRDPTMFLCSV